MVGPAIPCSSEAPINVFRQRGDAPPWRDVQPMPRSIAHPHGDEGLAAHPHRWVLNGEPGHFDLPPLCPNCGAAATESIRVHKVFDVAASDDPNRYLPTTLALPVCAACAAQHRAGTVEPTLLKRFATSFETFDMVGAIAMVVGAMFFAYLALKKLFGGDLISAALLMILPALLLLFARVQYRKALEDTAYRRVPERSEVARSFDYSDNVAAGFEPPRFVVTVKDAGFAKAFETLNAPRLYRADSPGAVADQRAARHKVWGWGVLLAVLLLLSIAFGD